MYSAVGRECLKVRKHKFRAMPVAIGTIMQEEADLIPEDKNSV